MRTFSPLLVALALSTPIPAGASDSDSSLRKAESLYEQGDYNASRDLCEAMAAQNVGGMEAEALLARTKRQMQRLAREAWEYGAILESVNRPEDALQYWHRAERYLRPGDHYYAWVQERIEHYEGTGGVAAAPPR